jgi:uncharacterized protein
MTAVSNTSPLILLEKTDHLWILEKLFTKVLIPPAVDREWLRPGGYVLPQWLSVTALSRQAASVAEGLHQKIDVGEAEAIALFSTTKADWLLLDDLKGRTQAASMGLPVIGTVGILIIAKKKGLIPAIRPVLNILKKHRFYLSDEVLAKALALTGEG